MIVNPVSFKHFRWDKKSRTLTGEVSRLHVHDAVDAGLTIIDDTGRYVVFAIENVQYDAAGTIQLGD